MIKNRTVQLIFQSFFCAFGVVGIFSSIGFFDYKFYDVFYVMFTNLSNYLCVGIMFAQLVQTAKKKGDGYVNTAPILMFIAMLGILLTFLVFNIMLAPTREAALNFSVGSILFHVVLPLMFIADWILFYERKQIKWYYPLLSVFFPLTYAAFIFIRAWALNFNPSAPSIYPYFFLNLDNLGVAGVAKWILILFVCFVVVGYIFFAFDRLIKSPKKQ